MSARSSQQQPRRRHTLFVALLILMAALVVSLSLWMTAPPAAAPVATAAPPPPANSLPVVAGLGGDFSLPATTGVDVSLTGLRGKVVLLNFGFTHCPDVCPAVLSRLGNVLRALEEQGVDMRRVQPLFVTFDPARDTLAYLREYLAFFHPSLIGLRGDDAQTREIARRYRVIYLKQDSEAASGYVFQHSNFVYVLDTYGRVRLLVGSKDPDAALSEAVKRLLAEEQAAPAPVAGGSIRIVDAWVRAVPAASETSAGYLVIHNDSARDDVLIGARIAGVSSTGIHETVADGQTMTMRRRSEVQVPAHGRVTLAPGGLHLMLSGLSQPLRPGEQWQGVLKFRDAGEIPVLLSARGF